MRAERGRVTLRQKRGGRCDRTGGGNKAREVDWTREHFGRGLKDEERTCAEMCDWM